MTESEQFAKAVGAAIRKRREERGLTVEQLAEKANLAVYMLKDVENGKRIPSLIRTFRIAQALSCDVGAFVGEWKKERHAQF